MKRKKEADKSVMPELPMNFDGLVERLRLLIAQARQQALRAVDLIQVRTCWEMGRHIVEFEQGGAERAQYGARLLPRLAERLTAEFGKGFDERNLRHMRAFFQTFPIWDAVRSELSWTHYRLLLRVVADFRLSEKRKRGRFREIAQKRTNILYKLMTSVTGVKILDIDVPEVSP
mgnify:CR=1 FL=1